MSARYPRAGDTIEVLVTEGWPTPAHVRRAADAIDTFSIPKIGAILRSAADAIDAGVVDKPQPWDSAEMGEVWIFTTSNGYRRPYVRSAGGWRSVSRRNELAQSRDLRDGELAWKPEYAFEPENCPIRSLHGHWPKCNRCGTACESAGKGDV